MKEAGAEQVMREIHKMDRQVLITMGLTFAIVFPSIFLALRYRIPVVELELLILVLAAAVIGFGIMGALALMSFQARMKLAQDEPIIFSRKEKLQYMVVLWITAAIVVTVVPYLLMRIFLTFRSTLRPICTGRKRRPSTTKGFHDTQLSLYWFLTRFLTE